MVFSAAALVSCLLAMIAMIAMIVLGSLLVSFLKSLPQNRLGPSFFNTMYKNSLNYLSQEKRIQSSGPCLD